MTRWPFRRPTRCYTNSGDSTWTTRAVLPMTHLHDAAKPSSSEGALRRRPSGSLVRRGAEVSMTRPHHRLAPDQGRAGVLASLAASLVATALILGAGGSVFASGPSTTSLYAPG